MYAVINIAQNI